MELDFTSFISGIITTILLFGVTIVCKRCKTNDRVEVEHDTSIPSLRIHFTMDTSSESCLICMEPYQPNESAIECISCKSMVGHTSCFRSWYQREKTCPHCRHTVFHSNLAQCVN